MNVGTPEYSDSSTSTGALLVITTTVLVLFGLVGMYVGLVISVGFLQSKLSVGSIGCVIAYTLAATALPIWRALRVKARTGSGIRALRAAATVSCVLHIALLPFAVAAFGV